VDLHEFGVLVLAEEQHDGPVGGVEAEGFLDADRP
jgi:hypothetical protein